LNIRKKNLLKTKKQIEDWPQERELLFRPGRIKYVKKLIHSKDCVFCKEAQNGISKKGLCVFKAKYSMVVINKYPYNTGHILVLPIQHKGNLWDLKKDEYLELVKLLNASVKIINHVYKCLGMNIGMNHGKIAGAGIPDHLHWHIVPRWAGDTNFFPIIGETKVLPETLEQTYKKLIKAFSSLEL
jgi:ATP adenylyltransferase